MTIIKQRTVAMQTNNLLRKVLGDQVFIEAVTRGDYLRGRRLIEQIARGIDEDIRKLIACVHIPANGDECDRYARREADSVLNV